MMFGISTNMKMLPYRMCILILSLQFVLIGAQETCCRTDRIEAQRYFVETRKITTIAIDFKAKRFYETKDPTGDKFYIVDFGSQRKYSFENGKCRSSPFPFAQFFARCLRDDFDVPNFSLGQRRKSINVTAIGYKAYGISRTMLNTSPSDGCLPLFIHDVHADDQRTVTSFMFNLAPSVTGNNCKLYSDTSNCSKQSSIDLTDTPIFGNFREED